MLKYRAWDKITKQMYSVGVIDFANKKTQIVVIDKNENCYAEYWRSFDEVIFMEDSGLFDKNGKGIFEGDIINLINEDLQSINVVCEFGTARRTTEEGNVIDITGFYFITQDDIKTFPMVDNYLGKNDLEIFEVVGSIYDNPELLEV